MADENDVSVHIARVARVRRRLSDLDAERAKLKAKLETLEERLASDPRPAEGSVRGCGGLLGPVTV